MRFDNFRIRLLNGEDLEDYYQLIERNRPRLEDFFAGTIAKTRTFEDTQLFIADVLKKIEQKTYFPYLVIDETNKAIAGFIDVKNIDWNIPKAELGCYIDMNYENMGISKKALQVFVDYCFDHYSFNKLFLRTHQSNLAAQKIAEGAGFEVEGRIRKDYKTTSGELVDLIYYGRLKPELNQ